MNHKLEVINTLHVEEYDIDNDQIVYIAIANSIENTAILQSLGATEEDFKTMTLDSGLLDVAYFAFTKCGAHYFSVLEGFGDV